MALCPKCGTENLSTSKFCHQCGASLALTAPPAPELPSAPPPAPKQRKHQKPASRAGNIIMALVGVIVGIGLFIQLVHPFGLNLTFKEGLSRTGQTPTPKPTPTPTKTVSPTIEPTMPVFNEEATRRETMAVLIKAAEAISSGDKAVFVNE
ncbi:MAG: zinc ribbon domain-containing protein, partial [Chloroflexota bacterium]